MAQYLFLLYGDETRDADMTPEQWAALLDQHDAFSRRSSTRAAAS